MSMAGRYAADTKVSVSRSREELHRTLARYGATETLVHEKAGELRIGFVLGGYRVAVPMAMPEPDDYPTKAAYEREERRKWRVLLLLLKGRMELIEEGAETVTEAFLPYLMLPDGGLVGDEVIPNVRQAYRSGRMPEGLIPSLEPPSKVIELPARAGGEKGR